MSSIEIFQSIEDVNKHEWDSLANDQVLMCHGWLKTVEQTFSGNLSPRYLILYDRGRPIVATAYRQINSTDNFSNIDYFLFGSLKPFFSLFGISAAPLITSMLLKGYSNIFLADPQIDPVTIQKHLLTMLATIHNHSSHEKISIAFTKVISDDSQVTHLLQRNGYARILSLPLAYVDIVWDSFSDYKKDPLRVSRNTRRNINWEINRNRKEGIEIVVLKNLEGYEDRLYQLVTLNAIKYNVTAFPFERAFFRVLIENMPDEAKVYAAFKKDDLIGMSLFLAKDKIWHALLVGFDHHQTGNELTYFNTTYYYPIRDAIKAQCKRIYYGNSHYELKIRRGCQLQLVDAYYKPHGILGRLFAKPFFFLHRTWNRRKRSSVVRQQLKLN
jgi:predicted N-acyltransferase